MREKSSYDGAVDRFHVGEVLAEVRPVVFRKPGVVLNQHADALRIALLALAREHEVAAPMADFSSCDVGRVALVLIHQRAPTALVLVA